MSVRKFGRFRISGEIGLGGMARVYQAYDPRRRRQVAVKVLPPEYLNDLGFRARFEQEAQLVIALKHKAIVPVYEYGEHEGQPYIVMKYLPNGSLAGRLAHGPLDPEQAASVLERIGSALDYAHQQGVVHRDLKPSNVLFDQYDKAYLADFGIAMQASLAWEPTRTISGTPAYMSPEQVLREQIDSRTDIYSLGVIAFEMLSGRLPYQGDSPVVVALKQVYDPPPRLSTIREGLPLALEAVVLRALSKDAEKRYPTAAAFIDAFRRASKPDLETLDDVDTLVAEVIADATAPRQAPKQPEDQPPKAGFHMPALPEIQAAQPTSKSSMLGQLIVALGMATFLGGLLAVVIAALVWGGTAAADANVQLVYDDTGMAVINLSGRPLDIGGLSFIGVSESGVVTAYFQAAQWEHSGLGSASALPGGACYQLLSLSQAPLHLSPGEAPAKPTACLASQGWLLAFNQYWQFWTSESGRGTIQVIYAEQLIHTCQIAEGSCQFTLPEP